MFTTPAWLTTQLRKICTAKFWHRLITLILFREIGKFWSSSLTLLYHENSALRGHTRKNVHFLAFLAFRARIGPGRETKALSWYTELHEQRSLLKRHYCVHYLSDHACVHRNIRDWDDLAPWKELKPTCCLIYSHTFLPWFSGIFLLTMKES